MKTIVCMAVLFLGEECPASHWPEERSRSGASKHQEESQVANAVRLLILLDRARYSGHVDAVDLRKGEKSRRFCLMVADVRFNVLLGS